MSTLHAVVVTASDRPGMMSAVTKVLADHQANIRYVDLHPGGDRADIYFEFTLETAADNLFADLKGLDGVFRLEEIPSFAKIYGKRIIVMSDPIQAGVMAVMAIADTAKFDLVRQQKRRY
jgi:energy-converting hydrogenase B subunit Q